MKRMELVLLLLVVLPVSHDAAGLTQVKAHVGDGSVSLPFLTDPLDSLGFPTVEWTRQGSSLETVHFRVKQGDDLRKQSPAFRDRTRMDPDPLGTGDLTLVLLRPNVSDSGVYKCSVRDGVSEVQHTSIELRVTSPGQGPGPDPGPIVGGVLGGAVALTALGLVAATLKRKSSSKESCTDACLGVLTCRSPPSVL